MSLVTTEFQNWPLGKNRDLDFQELIFMTFTSENLYFICISFALHDLNGISIPFSGNHVCVRKLNPNDIPCLPINIWTSRSGQTM